MYFSQAAAAIPLAIRLITYNIRYANNWPVEGEGKLLGLMHVLTHINGCSQMGG